MIFFQVSVHVHYNLSIVNGGVFFPPDFEAWNFPMKFGHMRFLPLCLFTYYNVAQEFLLSRNFYWYIAYDRLKCQCTCFWVQGCEFDLFLESGNFIIYIYIYMIRGENPWMSKAWYGKNILKFLINNKPIGWCVATYATRVSDEISWCFWCFFFKRYVDVSLLRL